MLRLSDVKKDYLLKDQEAVHALKGINLNFRRNEFVAILGHSGCGKTTLLNIIGGLDEYTSGDLVIEGVSTKSYKDRDWDTYRNHSIGFVFQSYNLIPHQSLLQNVELALTISGVPKKERIERAKKALETVGLKSNIRKKPNQLSGGQMQRVAIARALVNDPEILLADEPTGALDSETSIQIMNLLKEVAKDRLVIMVTHNPDLANTYANRIVRMSDGLIIDDTNPYSDSEEIEDCKKYKELVNNNEIEVINKGNKKKSSMSFFTAAGLSMSNLLAKLRRTILVTIAGSIGIIGVSAVLAVSHGVNGFIDNMQNDMLSSYPVGITEETIDYTSLMTGLDNASAKELFKFDLTTEVGLNSMINYLMSAYKGFTNTKTNDINDELVEYIGKIPKDDAAFISYKYGIDPTNNIFTTWNKDYESSTDVISTNGLTQRYIASLKTVEGFSDYASYVDLFTDFMKELPDNKDYILDQYELLGGSRYPENENEMVLVVDEKTTLTDLILAQLGYYDHNEFLNISKLAIKENELNTKYNNGEITEKERADELEKYTNKYPYRRAFKFNDLLDKEYYYFPHDAIYKYEALNEDKTYTINAILSGGTSLITLQYDYASDTLTGLVLNLLNSSYGICYLQRQTEVFDINEPSDIIKGNWVGINGDTNHFIVLNLMDTMGDNMVWFTDDIASFNPMSSTPTFFNCQTQTQENPGIVSYYYRSTLSTDMINNPESYNGSKMKVVGILRVKEGVNFGCLSTGIYYTKDFARKYMDDAQNSDIINNPDHGFKAKINNPESTDQFKAYVTFDYLDYSTDTAGVPAHGYSSCLNGDLGSSFSNLFSNLTGVNNFEQDQIHLRSLSGLKAVPIIDTNEYEFKELPESIDIYPWDFETKDHITDYLDKWNEDPNHSEIKYRDTISIIASVIDTLVKVVTIALISFTSLSLVVSCFMIAVITYISVMERVKEIGVIRSLGGRKKDVSRLFISETLITGLLSGIFGIIVTFLLCIILNVCIKKYNVGNIGDLTINTAIIMVTLSVVLNVVSGLIPSMRASRQDPVTALRSE